jgi:hypothetical protein
MKIVVSINVKFEENLAYRRYQESSTLTQDAEKYYLKDEKQSIA